MAQILVMAKDNTHSDPIKDRRGCYKKGYCVVIKPDDHTWGLKEKWPNFVILKIPHVSVEKVKKYTKAHTIDLGDDEIETYRRKLWKIRWDDLPQNAKNILKSNGEMTIKAKASYTGSYDYTWAQIKNYFRNQATGLDETEDL